MSSSIRFKAKRKPKWYQFRWRLASAIVALARWIHPDNPDLLAFVMQQMMDIHTYGTAMAPVSWKDLSDFITPRGGLKK